MPVAVGTGEPAGIGLSPDPESGDQVPVSDRAAEPPRRWPGGRIRAGGNGAAHASAAHATSARRRPGYGGAPSFFMAFAAFMARKHSAAARKYPPRRSSAPTFGPCSPAQPLGWVRGSR
ncbi:hypothetical protein GCM10010219_63580 [Streptomyces netropsis]|nr:hypothetical protein GCM10010219_63580 [Streptomyces netropsis]